MHQPPRSYFSPKVKIGQSSIHGLGLIATENIKKDEIVGIKDGYIIEMPDFIKMGGWQTPVGEAALQIEDNFLLGPTKEEEISLTMMHVNHSCEPTLGFSGNIVLVAIRDIKAGEELATDYAMWLSDPSYNLSCSCGSSSCRGSIGGEGWKDKSLQEKYKGYFSAYIQRKINSNQ